ncbi:metallophosphoesterase [Methanosarcina sp.]|uniref:metallophosphoesterase n=1 Tax=Methanosarcina sp. TaxID=2213 RepID=UPI003C726FBE
MAREIRILHTADTHLGYRQYHSEARRTDFFAAFELVVNDAVEMQVDAVVHAGDLFDSRNPTLEDLLETMNLLSRLKVADIPFFGIVGNHESKQNTQWLDLFEEMGLAARLGKKPLMVGNVAVYGIDSVPKSKIPIFDYSGFEAPDSTLSTSLIPSTSSIPSAISTPSTSSTSSTSFVPSTSSTSSTSPSPSASSSPSTSSIPSAISTPFTPPSPEENCWKLLVMHQIMNPFPYAEWDCDEVLENLPFRVDAVLLGDYHEHAITKNKTGETWITYPGSTERNSVSEKEARSYNIVTFSETGVEISKRTIPTRKFLSIPVELTGEDKPYEQIYSKVNEHLEEIPESVVFLEVTGDLGAVLSFSELEGYLLKKGALVAKVTGLRIKESLPEEVLEVTFSDPDHAVADEIKRMSLNDGGLIIDEIVRSPNISRSRVDEETEGRLSKLIEAKVTDFKSPDFRIEIPSSPSTASGFPELEITELSGILRTSDGNPNIEKKTTKKSIEASAASLDSSGLASGSNSEHTSNSGSIELLDSGSAELSNGSIKSQQSGFPQETSEIQGENPGTGIEFLKDKDNEPEIKSEIQPEIKSEIKPEIQPEIRPEIKPEIKPVSGLPDSEPEKEIRKLSEPGAKGKPEKETPGKSGKLPEEKPARATELGKPGKAGQKKGKGKPAVPRQYNLGDYL